MFDRTDKFAVGGDPIRAESSRALIFGAPQGEIDFISKLYQRFAAFVNLRNRRSDIAKSYGGDLR